MKYAEMFDDSFSESLILHDGGGRASDGNDGKAEQRSSSSEKSSNKVRKKSKMSGTDKPSKRSDVSKSPRRRKDTASGESSDSNGSSGGRKGGGFKRIITLYDAESTIDLPPSVAEGYITLLGGRNSKAMSQDPSVTALAFASVTDGNVIEACFGVKVHSATASASKTAAGKVTVHQRMVRDAKDAIGEAALADDDVAIAIVNAYKKAFECIVQADERIRRTNLLLRCVVQKAIRRDTEEALQLAFQPAEELIQKSLSR